MKVSWKQYTVHTPPIPNVSYLGAPAAAEFNSTQDLATEPQFRSDKAWKMHLPAQNNVEQVLDEPAVDMKPNLELGSFEEELEKSAQILDSTLIRTKEPSFEYYISKFYSLNLAFDTPLQAISDDVLDRLLANFSAEPQPSRDTVHGTKEPAQSKTLCDMHPKLSNAPKSKKRTKNNVKSNAAAQKSHPTTATTKSENNAAAQKSHPKTATTKSENNAAAQKSHPKTATTKSVTFLELRLDSPRATEIGTLLNTFVEECMEIISIQSLRKIWFRNII
jgi:hypothetical protein